MHVFVFEEDVQLYHQCAEKHFILREPNSQDNLKIETQQSEINTKIKIILINVSKKLLSSLK